MSRCQNLPHTESYGSSLASLNKLKEDVSMTSTLKTCFFFSQMDDTGL